MKPIIFNGEMVRAILDGRKTQTRRVIVPQPKIEIADYNPHRTFDVDWNGIWFKTVNGFIALKCPYGVRGNKLWVRETFVIESNFNLGSEKDYPPTFCDGRPIRRVDDPEYGSYWEQCHYRATDPKPELIDTNTDKECGWRPSIHMPRWASRLALEIVNVRVERLQHISEADARAEGIENVLAYHSPADYSFPLIVRQFAFVWNEINFKRGFGWGANPWVWVVTFKRM